MNFPILSSITFLPLIGAFFILLTKEEKNETNKGAIYVSIFTTFVNFFLSLFLWYSFDKSTSDFQFLEEFLPQVVCSNANCEVVDKSGNIKGYLTQNELSKALAKENLKEAVK